MQQIYWSLLLTELIRNNTEESRDYSGFGFYPWGLFQSYQFTFKRFPHTYLLPTQMCEKIIPDWNFFKSQCQAVIYCHHRNPRLFSCLYCITLTGECWSWPEDAPKTVIYYHTKYILDLVKHTKDFKFISLDILFGWINGWCSWSNPCEPVWSR